MFTFLGFAILASLYFIHIQYFGTWARDVNERIRKLELNSTYQEMEKRIRKLECK